MVHRYRINRRTLLGPDNQVISSSTTRWDSGTTLTSNWTNANTFPTQGDPTNTIPPMNQVSVTNTVSFDQQIYNKSITIPIQLKFEPMDYSDSIDKWVEEETQKTINKILDSEKVKYETLTPNLEIEFRFATSTTNYSSLYINNGFTIPDFKFNKFKKSFFRLYFYDSNEGETANLLFTEDFPTEENDAGEAIFNLKRLFWEREDIIMQNTTTDRIIYMEGRFFNANTGRIQTFYNPPISKLSPIRMSEYSNPVNKEWRTSPIKLFNPNNTNGEHRFIPIHGVGGNDSLKITLSEFIIK